MCVKYSILCSNGARARVNALKGLINVVANKMCGSSWFLLNEIAWIISGRHYGYGLFLLTVKVLLAYLVKFGR